MEGYSLSNLVLITKLGHNTSLYHHLYVCTMRLISAHIIVGKVEREKQKEVGVKFKYNNYKGRKIRQVAIPVFYMVIGYNIDLFGGCCHLP